MFFVFDSRWKLFMQQVHYYILEIDVLIIMVYL